MANSISHASLPYPVKNARYTVLIDYLDADGDPTDPVTPDTEISIDNGAFADCAEEITLASGTRGAGMITLTGAEMDCSAAMIWAGSSSGPKAMLRKLSPRLLPILFSGTAGAGAAGSLTLPATAPFLDLTGCIVRTTGGTGGGGAGGINNQARVVTAYDVTTRVATVVPNWETNPDATTTFDILITEMAAAMMIALSFKAIVHGTAETGTLSTTQASTTLSGFGTNRFVGKAITWLTGANVQYGSKSIEASDNDGVLTFGQFPGAPENGDKFQIT
jgi:hypothetical protein